MAVQVRAAAQVTARVAVVGVAAQVAAQVGVAAQAVGSWVATQVGVVALVAVQGLCTGTQDQAWCGAWSSMDTSTSYIMRVCAGIDMCYTP